MAHEIEILNNKASMFSVKEVCWHKLGTILEDAPSIKEAIVLAGLDWETFLQPNYQQLFSMNNEGEYIPSYVPVDGSKLVVRGSDSKVLGVVGSKYRPLQNTDAFAWFQPFLDTGLVELETGGCLNEGKKCWIMAKIKGADMVIKGNDTVRKYILLSNSHDGSTSISAGFVPTRVVCMNSLKMAIGNKGSQLLKIRHTSSAQDTLDKVREIMNVANQEFEATAAQYRRLAERSINTKELEKYVKIVLGQDKPADEIKGKGQNQIDRIITLFDHGMGNDLPEIKHTAWSLYNSMTQWLTHEAGSNDDKRMNSLFFGGNSVKNQLALDEALKLVNA